MLSSRWARNRDVERKWWARFCTCVRVCRTRHRAPSILPDVCEIYHAQPRSSGLVKLYVRLISRVMTRFSAHINPRKANDVTTTRAADLGSILTPVTKKFSLYIFHNKILYCVSQFCIIFYFFYREMHVIIYKKIYFLNKNKRYIFSNFIHVKYFFPLLQGFYKIVWRSAGERLKWNETSEKLKE